MKPPPGIFGAALIVALAPAAHALCIYNGVDNAKTSISQEFKDSRWVVRAKVLSARDYWSDKRDSWTIYELAVMHAYKGMPQKRLRFFTYRDSGGFYMDRPWVKLPEGHDIGGEYLLFLTQFPHQQDAPRQAKGAVFVNYPCGVSGRWIDLGSSARTMLNRLEHGD